MSERDDEMIYEGRSDKSPGIGLIQMVFLGLVGLPVLVTLILNAFGMGWFSLLGGALSGVLAYRLWRRNDRAPQIILSVRRKKLAVHDETRMFEIALADLEDVTLEKKEIQKLREGSPVIPGLMVVNGTVGEASEIVRVTLEGTDTTFPLTKDFQPYSAGLEGMGKVRVFLRKNGWVPPSERWAPDADAAPKKKKKRKSTPTEAR